MEKVVVAAGLVDCATVVEYADDIELVAPLVNVGLVPFEVEISVYWVLDVVGVVDDDGVVEDTVNLVVGL